jgi:hypothetical protein
LESDRSYNEDPDFSYDGNAESELSDGEEDCLTADQEATLRKLIPMRDMPDHRRKEIFGCLAPGNLDLAMQLAARFLNPDTHR